jgi:predicted PurR-regulated permease PerM
LRIEVTWRTIFKLLLGVLLGYAAVKLREVFELVIVAIFFAVVLYRIVTWACEKHMPRWVGLLLATLAMLLVIGGVLGAIVPMAVHQASTLTGNLPHLKQQIVAKLPQSGPLHEAVQRAINAGTGPGSQQALGKAFEMLKSTVGGLFDLVVVIALVIYLMVDGPRTLEWWVAFFPNDQRLKVAAGLAEIGRRIVAYVLGQLLVSALFASYTFILLSVLKVPMALLLAILAGMVDVLPIIGIVIAATPATLIALTVSPAKAFIVVGGYALYHIIESYFIVPKVYGNRLKISTLAVLLAMLIGGVLAGVVGAIVALPLVAAYPALERLWLAPPLEPEVVKDHEHLRAA